MTHIFVESNRVGIGNNVLNFHLKRFNWRQKQGMRTGEHDCHDKINDKSTNINWIFGDKTIDNIVQ